MLLAHTVVRLDGRTRSDRPDAFRRVLILGGFGAPLFLWLAVVASVLFSAERAFRRERQPQSGRIVRVPAWR
jgi:hypothetical protein